MWKKYSFYISLIIIYLLFLMKDSLFSLIDNRTAITENTCQSNSLYYQEEYEKILQSLNIDIPNQTIIYSKIIIRDIYDFYNKITISKGENANLKVGDIVINEQGLIGIIAKVAKNYSEVKLITNKDTNISVKINDSYGILYAIDNKLYVKNIKLDNIINIGDIVYTSGLTNIPENIKIGTVKKVNKDSLELEYILDIDSYNNFNKIKYVGVISS